MEVSFTVTADGSKTLFNPAVGENYHSRHGALQESKHVFLESGLKYFLSNGASSANILEVGFGTGLNFLVSADYCRQNNITLTYTGIEAYPLASDLISATGYNEYVSPGIWKDFLTNYESALATEVAFDTSCKLEIPVFELLHFETEERYDVIYFDAFAAVHQPEMWNETSLAHVAKFLKPGGIFVTYAITGNLKRAMKANGFTIEKAPGAPGKREMLRATKLPGLLNVQ